MYLYVVVSLVSIIALIIPSLTAYFHLTSARFAVNVTYFCMPCLFCPSLCACPLYGFVGMDTHLITFITPLCTLPTPAPPLSCLYHALLSLSQLSLCASQFYSVVYAHTICPCCTRTAVLFGIFYTQHTLALTRSRQHANRVSGVDEYILRVGPPWGSELPTQNANVLTSCIS